MVMLVSAKVLKWNLAPEIEICKATSMHINRNVIVAETETERQRETERDREGEDGDGEGRGRGGLARASRPGGRELHRHQVSQSVPG